MGFSGCACSYEHVIDVAPKRLMAMSSLYFCLAPCWLSFSHGRRSSSSSDDSRSELVGLATQLSFEWGGLLVVFDVCDLFRDVYRVLIRPPRSIG